MDRDDGVLAIVLAAEHLLGLAGVDHGRELVEPAGEIVQHRLPAFGPFDEDGEILGAALQRVAQVAILFEPAAALQQFLRARLVLPEVRMRRRAVLCSRARRRDWAASKIAPQIGWRGARDPDTCEAVRRVEWP